MQRTQKNRTRPCEAPVAKRIGFHVLGARRGRAVVTLKAQKHHENTVGTCHGGILCDIADAAMGCAFESVLSEDQYGVTVEMKINFLMPAHTRDRLSAKAKIISHGKTLYYLECEIRNARKSLIAKAACTCKIIRPSSAAPSSCLVC